MTNQPVYLTPSGPGRIITGQQRLATMTLDHDERIKQLEQRVKELEETIDKMIALGFKTEGDQP